MGRHFATIIVLCAALHNFAMAEELRAEDTTQLARMPNINPNPDFEAMSALLDGQSRNSGRKILQASADAISFNNEVTTGARAYCTVYNALNVPDTCPSQAPYPACCDANYCYSNANGASGKCNKAGTSGSCCPAFNQKASVCVYPDSKGTCSNPSRPVPGCCDSYSCSVNKNSAGGYCNSQGSVAKCCPA